MKCTYRFGCRIHEILFRSVVAWTLLLYIISYFCLFIFDCFIHAILVCVCACVCVMWCSIPGRLVHWFVCSVFCLPYFSNSSFSFSLFFTLSFFYPTFVHLVCRKSLLQRREFYFRLDSTTVFLFLAADRMLDELQLSISPQRGPTSGSASAANTSHSVTSGRSNSSTHSSSEQRSHQHQGTARRLFDTSAQESPSVSRVVTRSHSSEQHSPQHEVNYVPFPKIQFHYSEVKCFYFHILKIKTKGRTIW